jgi:hypothetical protein
MRAIMTSCALVLASCEGGRGVDIEVTAPAGAQVVEMLVAPTSCTDTDGTSKCAPGIAWTAAGPQATGTIYSTDSDARDVVTVPANGRVRFRLVGTSKAPIARLAFVAFDANEQVLALSVLENVVVPKRPRRELAGEARRDRRGRRRCR